MKIFARSVSLLRNSILYNYTSLFTCTSQHLPAAASYSGGVPTSFNRLVSPPALRSVYGGYTTCYMFFATMSTSENIANSMDNSSDDPEKTNSFHPKNALVLTKFSRLEFEKRRHPNLSEDELIKNLEERGSDYKSLLHHHNIHTQNKDHVIDALRQHGIETRVIDRFDYTDENIEWADVVITTGGDGTFLMAASKIHSRDKPVIGVNSDPSRDYKVVDIDSAAYREHFASEYIEVGSPHVNNGSLGYLCLPPKYTHSFPEVLTKLKKGHFRWKWRQRIRITLIGESAYAPPIELHDQQLQYPEYRFLDCFQEQHRKSDSSTQSSESGVKLVHILPVRALNEVFIGESLSSRVSYYEISIDSSPRVKQKSSGLTICTGTGSTSWSFNINKVTPQCVHHLLKIINEETGSLLPMNDDKMVHRITTKFNTSLVFDPSEMLMAYTIRDPVVFGQDFTGKPRGFAKRIEMKSRMFDACLVIDGGLSFVFNDGAVAQFEILEEDSLRTISLLE